MSENTSGWRIGSVVLTLVLAMEVAPMAATLYFPATPAIGAAFQTDQVGWGATILVLVAAVMTPTVAKMGDLIGKKKTIIGVLSASLLGSVLCAVTSSFALFLVGRGLQGLAITAATISYGLIRDLLPRRYIPIAMGMLGTGLGMGMILAPFIAGWLVDGGGYAGIFWFIAVYSAVVIPMALVFVPESSLRVRKRFDIGGVGLLGGCAGLILIALSYGSIWGWSSFSTLGCVILGVTLGVAFVQWENRYSEPMFSIRILRSRPMATTCAVAFLGLFPIVSAQYVLPAVVETPSLPGLGYGFGQTVTYYAVLTMGFGIAGTICGPLGGYIAARKGPRTTMLLAMSAAAIGTGGIALFHSSPWQLAVWAIFVGVGFGLNFASTPNLLLEAVSAEEQSAGASLLAFAQNLGSAVVPILVTIVYTNNAFDTSHGHTIPNNTGVTLAIGVGFVSAVAAVALAFTMKHGRTPATGGAAVDRELLAH